jgi:hypothetical protein
VKIQGDLHQLAEQQEDLQHTRRGHPTSIAILATVEIAKANNGGIVPYAAMSDIVNSMKPTLPWLTKGMLRNHISKLNKEKIQKDAAKPPDEDVAATANSHSGGGSSTSTLSALTFDTTGGGNSATAAGTTGTTMGASTCSDENDNAAGGRPKGSSYKSKRDVKKRQRLALLEATKQYQRALKKKRQEDGATTCLMHGTLATIKVGKAKALCNVENFTIHPSSIRSRCKRNHINPVLVSQGTTSPMAAVEPYLIAIILQLARMRSPINATMGLHLANSLIQGTDIAKAIMAKRAKQKRQATVMTTRQASLSIPGEEQHPADKTIILLGSGYWNGFMRRHRHIIRSKRSDKFEAKPAEWCTYENFSDMYDHIMKQWSSMELHQNVT